jgi:hypothetical protein
MLSYYLKNFISMEMDCKSYCSIFTLYKPRCRQC